MQAIILKKNIFSEGNEIITMYTRELGKVRAVARSIKSPKSKLSYGLQGLFHTDVDILLSKQLSTIKGVKALNTFTNIYSNEKKILLAFYAVEIILKSTADEEPNEQLFDLFLNFLSHLDQSNRENHPCADIFVLNALALNGYALNYDKCAMCGKDLLEEVYFSNRKSGFVCAECGEKSTDGKRVSKNLYSALTTSPDLDYESLDQQRFDSSELHKLTESFATHILERNLNAAGYLGTL
jgi:DNA repair protein RecO (recombination protein O)